MRLLRQDPVLTSTGCQKLVSCRETVRYRSRGCQDFMPFPFVRRYMEPHHGHPCSDPKWNHIGETPGANPLDHATQHLFRIMFFVSGMGLSSGMCPRRFMHCRLTFCHRRHADYRMWWWGLAHWLSQLHGLSCALTTYIGDGSSRLAGGP